MYGQSRTDSRVHVISHSIICWCLWGPAKRRESTPGASQEYGSLVVASDLTATQILQEGVLLQGLL